MHLEQNALHLGRLWKLLERQFRHGKLLSKILEYNLPT